ncbi:MAG: hypothetical protein VX738_06415 [Planctomycetota bacterium]|nr:hypothetical protein [Planctomycetota bacterium]
MPDSKKAVRYLYMVACVNWVAVGLYYLPTDDYKIWLKCGGVAFAILAIVLSWKISGSINPSNVSTKQLSQIFGIFALISLVPYMCGALIYLLDYFVGSGDSTAPPFDVLRFNPFILIVACLARLIWRCRASNNAAKETAGQNENDLESQTTDPATDE